MEYNRNEASLIMEYVKSAKLKGKMDIGKDWFWWDLGGIHLYFGVDFRETTVEYHRHKSRINSIGHFHVGNCDVINLIKEINSEDKTVQITASPLGSSFTLIDNTSPKKKSRFLIRRYYSD